MGVSQVNKSSLKDTRQSPALGSTVLKMMLPGQDGSGGIFGTAGQSREASTIFILAEISAEQSCSESPLLMCDDFRKTSLCPISASLLLLQEWFTQK